MNLNIREELLSGNTQHELIDTNKRIKNHFLLSLRRELLRSALVDNLVISGLVSRCSFL